MSAKKQKGTTKITLELDAHAADGLLTYLEDRLSDTAYDHPTYDGLLSAWRQVNALAESA